MRVPSWMFGLVAVMTSTAASADTVFLPHSGGPEVMRGNGGTSLRRHGITVWTKGMPGTKFRVLGVIQDERSDKLLSGNALTSAAVARLVREHGGNAVLVGDVERKPIGVERGGVGGVIDTPSFSDQGDVIVNGVTTRLVVIRSDMDG